MLMRDKFLESDIDGMFFFSLNDKIRWSVVSFPEMSDTLVL